jgi:hypothetical protein
LILAKLTPITDPPPIIGDFSADQRFRMVAHQRGYRLQAMPDATLSVYDNQLLLPKVGEAWTKLKEAAQKDGIAPVVPRAVSSRICGNKRICIFT